MKLVTRRRYTGPQRSGHFNPHEREARDVVVGDNDESGTDFNPHEREARDDQQHHRNAPPIYFNPHEREARDDNSRGRGCKTTAF